MRNLAIWHLNYVTCLHAKCIAVDVSDYQNKFNVTLHENN